MWSQVRFAASHARVRLQRRNGCRNTAGLRHQFCERHTFFRDRAKHAAPRHYHEYLARVSPQRRKDRLHAARIHHRLHARLTACSDGGQSGRASCGNGQLAQVPQDRIDRRSRPARRSNSLGLNPLNPLTV